MIESFASWLLEGAIAVRGCYARTNDSISPVVSEGCDRLLVPSECPFPGRQSNTR
ncbi:hypothetical protein [Geitlerinema sp. PCC 9228]|uniref:hypothetical protein n=1 Tax=Geitlerinema sp. PCC 9228 TaxID=111611 RepID=UPI0014812A8F|nr:hypothetical protein [Geitlerinema sp. PCC 9228]